VTGSRKTPDLILQMAELPNVIEAAKASAPAPRSFPWTHTKGAFSMTLRAAVSFLLLSLALTTAQATTIVLPTDDQLISKSPVIVQGRVIESTPVDRNGGIYTETVVAVEAVVKGHTSETIVIREIGGRIEDRFNVVFGSPEYVKGENVLLFLWPVADGSFQTRDLFVGKFTERFTKAGARVWFRVEEADGTDLLNSELQPVAKRDVQRDAQKFSEYVAARVAGRQLARSYEVVSPEFGSDTFQANFSMISEPSMYRWFGFQRGTTANWVSIGSQPGYTGGGVTELRNGMSPWVNNAGSTILYTYSGSSTAAPGGLGRPNGLNEIMFDDPLQEIDGTYTASAGGVIGRGGFNNVKPSGTWTSGSPVQTYATTGDIVEGNLVIQDGVNFSAGLLTAVIAHELGHTLGFGHSTDPTALMYASLRSGSTGALSSDDQAGARWLYPSANSGGGGATPPPPPPATTLPAAPSGLVATPGTGNRIGLMWQVNAANASLQYVYVASGSGPFSRVGSVSAAANAATLGDVPAGTYRMYVTASNAAGESAASNIAQATMAGAQPVDTTALSLQTGRFRVTLTARDQRTGKTGTGQAIPQNDLFGYFSLPELTGNASNPEVFIKVIDGRAVNGTYWVFYGGLTDLEYTLRVVDSATGVVKSYSKAAGGSCGGFDTSAFASNSTSESAPVILGDNGGDVSSIVLIDGLNIQQNACSAGSGNLCALGGRFSITLSARDQRSGKTAAGQSLPQNDLFGYFSLPGLTGNSSNPEVFVKVLDGRAVNGKYWVFWSGLTDLEYIVTVSDSLTGVVKQYRKEPGSACGGFDTSAF